MTKITTLTLGTLIATLLVTGCASSNKNRSVLVAPTVFKLVDRKTSKLGSGDFLTDIRLTPVGQARIPLIIVDAETRNGAIIKSLTINAQGMSMGSASEVGVHSSSMAKDVHPQKISIQMVTDKNPADFQMGIKPFSSTQ